MNNALQKHKFLKALTSCSSYYTWSQQLLLHLIAAWPALHSFEKKSVFATHAPLKTWIRIAQYLLLYPKPEAMLLVGILVAQGLYKTSVNHAGHSISSQVFGQHFLPHTHLHGAMWVQSMDSFSPGIIQHLLFVPHISWGADFDED